jgi:HSP20 family protein
MRKPDARWESKGAKVDTDTTRRRIQPSTIVGVLIMVLVSYARPYSPPLALRGFDDVVSRFFGDAAPARKPALDVHESDTYYTVQIDMPGIAKDSVDVAIEGRQVSVKAQSQRSEERKADEAPNAAAPVDRVVYRERASAAIARSFTLPLELDESQSSAKLDNGVLTLMLAKKREAPRSKITVN